MENALCCLDETPNCIYNGNVRNTLYTQDGVKLLINHEHSLDAQEEQSIGIRGVVFRVMVLSIDCCHSFSSLLRVPTVADIGLACISSATILPPLIAGALPSLLIGLVPWLPCCLILLLLVLIVLLLAVVISFLISCKAANID